MPIESVGTALATPMGFPERVEQLLQRVGGYLKSDPLVVLIELAVIWVVVYIIVRFLRGTRGARVIKGLAFLLIIGTLTVQVFGRDETFERLNFLYSNLLAVVSLMLVIVFQPELRRVLTRLGETRLFWGGGLRRAMVIDKLIGAVQYLSQNKIGALIAIQREVGLRGIVEQATRLDAEVSTELLKTIFWPGTVLHDLGMVIHGDRVVAAGVQFPLAEGEQIPQELGSRHRAAIGLSQEADALVLVVSEETGAISVAERGELHRNLTIEELHKTLNQGLGRITIPPRQETDTTEEEAVGLPKEPSS